MRSSKRTGTTRIARAGALYADEKHRGSRTTLQELMRAIELEIDGNDGIYPYNDGKLTVDELLRRAGKSAAYLQKKIPKIEALKKEVNEWIRRVKGQAAIGAPSVRKAVNERVNAAKQELTDLRQAYSESELLLTSVTAKLAEAAKKVDRLEQENADLLKKLAGKTVVEFKPEQRN